MIALLTASLQAFESFINRNPRAPEFISLYIDENLKKGLKGVSRTCFLVRLYQGTDTDIQKSDQEVDDTLDKTITIFRYITEKDAFERYYKTHLAKRLLNNRSVSDDAERGMLAKLKVECGFHFTQKLEGMFTDMKVSADMMDAYRHHIDKAGTVRILFS
jgi:cullin 3